MSDPSNTRKIKHKETLAKRLTLILQGGEPKLDFLDGIDIFSDQYVEAVLYMDRCLPPQENCEYTGGQLLQCLYRSEPGTNKFRLRSRDEIKEIYKKVMLNSGRKPETLSW